MTNPNHTSNFTLHTSLKPYPAMKDSDVEWLGKVPEHWEVCPGRSCFYEKKESNIGMVEKIVLSLSYGQIVVKLGSKAGEFGFAFATAA